MGHIHEQRARTALVVIIALAATAAAITGIVSAGGPGPRIHETFRGTEVMLYNHGIYRHMSADVAIQGIAQDVVTVAIAVPLLLLALLLARLRSPRSYPAAQLGLAGTLLYFLVTYTFYLAMATYNELFLLYALLMGCSFFALIVVVLETGPTFTAGTAPDAPGSGRLWGAVLIINAALIGMLWLSVVVPPLLDGSLYPAAVQHYTTLIVQGFDLAVLLPATAVT